MVTHLIIWLGNSKLSLDDFKLLGIIASQQDFQNLILETSQLVKVNKSLTKLKLTQQLQIILMALNRN